MTFAGRPLASWLGDDRRAYRRQVQAVFQQPALALDPLRTIGWAVAEPLVIHRARPARRPFRPTSTSCSARSASVANWSIAGRRSCPAVSCNGSTSPAHSLSQPRLLVCDEAVSSLDVSVQAQILNLLLDIHERDGVAMLFVSHDLAVVRHIADRVVVLLDGRVVEVRAGRGRRRSPAGGVHAATRRRRRGPCSSDCSGRFGSPRPAGGLGVDRGDSEFVAVQRSTASGPCHRRHDEVGHIGLHEPLLLEGRANGSTSVSRRASRRRRGRRRRSCSWLPVRSGS